MSTVTQLTVACENRPGALAQIARVLGAAKVNVRALLATTAGTQGFVGIVADKPARARKALEAAGLHCSEQTLLQVELPNEPGALGRFAERLAAKDINITAAYQTSVRSARKASVVFAVSDLGGAARLR